MITGASVTCVTERESAEPRGFLAREFSDKQFAVLKGRTADGYESKMMIPPSTKPISSSPAAERMRRHRERRRRGLTCLHIELRRTEIDELIRQGLLKAETRNDLNAVRKAFYGFLESAMG